LLAVLLIRLRDPSTRRPLGYGSLFCSIYGVLFPIYIYISLINRLNFFVIVRKTYTTQIKESREKISVFEERQTGASIP
jgi:hypothetical protein